MVETSKHNPPSPSSDSPDLGLYAHVPFCKHECPYCDFYKFSIKGHPARQRLDFPENLFRELQQCQKLDPEIFNRLWKTLYFGGGTPGILPAKNLAGFMEGFWSNAQSKGVSEVTLEVNPENITESNVSLWKEMGITRLSIGVQSFHDDELKRLERLHDRATIFKALELLPGNFENYSIDLMYSLPDQSVERFLENLQLAVQFQPKHLSFYGLTIHEGTPFELEFNEGKLQLPSDSHQAAMYLQGHDFLASQGFGHYEVSNYAQPGFESQHNQRYWQRQDVIGFGPGAWSNIGDHRWSNVEDIVEWEKSLQSGKHCRTMQETLTQRQAEEELLHSALRTREGVNFAQLNLLKPSLTEWLNGSVAKQLTSEKLVIHDAENIRLSIKGWLLSDSIIRSLSEHMNHTFQS